MAKTIITFLLLAPLIVGCGSLQVKEVHKPILYCPAPNTDKIGRPDPLAHQSVTDNMSEGEVVKRYKASVKQLLDYSVRLEKALRKYDSTHEAYEQLRKEFLKQKQQDGLGQE